MNYALHFDFGDMAFETWYEMYTKPEAAENVLVGRDRNTLAKVAKTVY